MAGHSQSDGYACWYRLDRQDGYLLWFDRKGDEPWDGVYVDGQGRVPALSTRARLRVFAASLGIGVVDEEPLMHDLDALETWLVNPMSDSIDCDVLLTAWNIFGDLAHSLRAPFDSEPDATIDLYQKLVWGNNLPALTPPGEHYVPSWDENEAARLAALLSGGLQIFRSAVFHEVRGPNEVG